MTMTTPRSAFRPAFRTIARPLALAAAVLCGAAAARAAEPMGGMHGMDGMKMDHGAATSSPGAVPPADGPTPADKAYAAANATMMKDMEVKPTGDADRDFVEMMLPHHQGAIDMARVEARYGRDPVLRRLAADIVAAQEREIATMRGWKKAHPGGAPTGR